jgi:transcriptional regulator with XRE-family HTH domain
MEAPSPTHAEHVGNRLREARIRAGISQTEVARRAGLSISFVRLVERGKSDISLARLLRWTTIFGIPVADIVAEPTADDIEIVTPADRVLVPSREAGVQFWLLSLGGNRLIEPAIFDLAHGAQMRHPVSYEGEEAAFVLRGRVQLRIGDREILLNEGDAVYYSSSSPRTYANVGRGPASVLVTTTNPRVGHTALPVPVPEPAERPRTQAQGAAAPAGTDGARPDSGPKERARATRRAKEPAR